MSVYITGCEKEKNMLPETQNDEISTRSVTNEQPTQEEIAIAKQLFYLQIQNVASTPEEDKGPLMDIWTSFVPSWKTGEVIAKTNYRLILFPTFTGVDESNYKLAFFINDNNDAALGLIGYERTNLNNPESFTGKIYQITNDGYTANEILIKNNLPVGRYYSHTNIKYFNQNSNELEFRGGDGIWFWDTDDFWKYLFGNDKDERVGGGEEEGEGSGGTGINHNLPTIGCYAACPDGWSDDKCAHPRDCDGLITGCESAQEVFPDCDCTETPTSITIICDDGDDENDNNDTVIKINKNGNNNSTGGSSEDVHKKTLKDIVSEITRNNGPFDSCDEEVDPGINASFNPMFEFQEFLNLSADELLSVWGNNTAEALVNAILSSDGDLANSIYNQVKQQNDLEYDIDNPVHQAVLKAIQELIKDINNANGACDSIMKMSDFIKKLEKLLKKEKEKLCTDNLNTFISNYNLDLTQEQKDEILYNSNVSCGDDDQEKFEEEALDIIFNNTSFKEPGVKSINLNSVFSNCFGEPDESGNYIDCSSVDNGAYFTFTLYSDQPIDDSRKPYSGSPVLGNLYAGHTFISFSTNYSGEDKTITFGFYPVVAVNNNNLIVPSKIGDDSDHKYTSSVTLNLSCDDFNNALNNSKVESLNNYDLNNYNCTDYGINIANSIGLGVNDTESSLEWKGRTLGKASNPGDLGEDIKLLNNGNGDNGNAPKTNCN